MTAPFRPAAAPDVEAVLALAAAYYADEGYAFDPAATRAAIGGLIADAALGRLWVATDDAGTVVAYCALTLGWSLEHRGRDAFVDELYVAPAHRKRGLGRAALALAEETAGALGVGALHLEVEPDNTRAATLYRDAGFVDGGRRLLTKRLVTRPR